MQICVEHSLIDIVCLLNLEFILLHLEAQPVMNRRKFLVLLQNTSSWSNILASYRTQNICCFRFQVSVFLHLMYILTM